MKKNTKTLVNLKPGDRAMVTGVDGGLGLVKNLENLGIRPGVGVKVVSRHFMRGPVVVLVGNSRVAIGFGMAKKIVTEPED
ncbi:MAG TPA: FeoA family protein [Candidatus Krumholzibacteriaceae bacterium]|nr:FeoA family protein [Candidatus Krumholzibacteriaceae bacterium]